MRRHPRSRSLLLLPFVAAAAAGCSSLTASTDSGFSAEASNAIASQVSKAFGNSMQTAHFSVAASRGMGGPFYDPTMASTLVNVSVTGRTTCTAGGTINVTGSMTGSISDQGSGALFLQVTETITDWQCVGGFVVNGDPYMSAAGTFTFFSGVLNSPATVSIGGGFRWGSTAAQSCQMQLTVLAYANGTGHTSGTVCGHQVDQTY